MKIFNISSIISHPLKFAYYIGFLKEEELSLPVEKRYGRIKWIDIRKYKEEGWFADPFILTVNGDTIELFAEEMIYRTGRGILVYLRIDKKSYEVLEKTTILDNETHLSFPIYIKENGKLYVYPENYQSGTVKLYEYNEKTRKLMNPRIIIDQPLLDTQIIKIDGTYYAFGVKYKTGRQQDTQVLYVYKSENLKGNYRCIQEIKNIRCEERGAGLIYVEGSRMIRPAQCCEGGYGKEVILYELCKDKNGFKEIEIERVVPDRQAQKGSILHTFNKMEGIVVVDGFAYNTPRLASFYKKLRGIKD